MPRVTGCFVSFHRRGTYNKRDPGNERPCVCNPSGPTEPLRYLSPFSVLSSSSFGCTNDMYKRHVSYFHVVGREMSCGSLSGSTQNEKEGHTLRARPAVNKGRTADSTQLSIFDYSISRDTPLSRPGDRYSNSRLSKCVLITCVTKNRRVARNVQILKSRDA